MASAPRIVLGALCVLCILLGLSLPVHAAPEAARTVKKVSFAAGSDSALFKGSVKGRGYTDYQLRAGAGQTLKASLQVSNRSTYFNILPPGSRDVAMFIEGGGDRSFDGLLPDDGVYTLRVYLVRAAARRQEAADFTLSIGLAGKALAPLPAKVDALVSGTRYHATTTVACEPAYAKSKARACEAGVVRRGHDGTATVELRWDSNGKRRVLFVKGRPEASDASQPFTFSRNQRGNYVLVFDGNERFEIPEPLVFGG